MRVHARGASLAALERRAVAASIWGTDVVQAQEPDEPTRPRSNSAAEAGMDDNAVHPPASTAVAGKGGNKLQKLKRLPSLSLRRGFTRRVKKVDTPTPGVVVSSACLLKFLRTSVPSPSSTSGGPGRCSEAPAQVLLLS